MILIMIIVLFTTGIKLLEILRYILIKTSNIIPAAIYSSILNNAKQTSSRKKKKIFVYSVIYI